MLVKDDELDVLQDQWTDLLYAKETVKNLNENATTFWSELKTVKDGNNEPRFACLSKFMCGLVALPHSSACVERVFLQLNMIKTKQTGLVCPPLRTDFLQNKRSAVKRYHAINGNHQHPSSKT